MSERTTRKDWILWGALGCTLVGTAHAEYTLAVATQVHWLVAGAVPGALDLYVIRALQKHRDVLPAVLVMVAANVASHLVTAGVLPVHWALISAVGALAPALLWRIHYLWRVQDEYGTGAVSAPEDQPYPDFTEPPAPAPEAYSWDTDYIPGWVQDEYTASTEAGAPSAETGAPESEEVHRESVLHSLSLPSLPPGFTAGARAEVHLKDGDHEYLSALKAYLDTCEETGARVSVRGCKEFCSVGQERAKRLLAYAGYPQEVQP